MNRKWRPVAFAISGLMPPGAPSAWLSLVKLRPLGARHRFSRRHQISPGRITRHAAIGHRSHASKILSFLPSVRRDKFSAEGKVELARKTEGFPPQGLEPTHTTLQ